MNNCIPSMALYLFCGSTILLLGCRGSHQKQPPNSANVISQLEQKWRTALAGVQVGPKDYPGARVDAMQQSIDGLTNTEQAAVYNYAIRLPPVDKWESFDGTLLQAVAEREMKCGNVDRVVQLFSQQFPPAIGIVPTEYILAQYMKDDFVTVLETSYNQAKRLPTQRYILAAVKRASGIPTNVEPGLDQSDDVSIGENPKEVLQRYKDWFTANRAALVLNPGYLSNEAPAPGRNSFGPLFVRRNVSTTRAEP